MSRSPDAPDEHDDPEQRHVESRADLLPEEEVAGSDDPEAQARAILEESEERTQDPKGTRDDSTQTPDRPVPEEGVAGS